MCLKKRYKWILENDKALLQNERRLLFEKVKLEKTEPQVKCRITFESGLKVAPIDFP
jgi:hypothetical protein